MKRLQNVINHKNASYVRTRVDKFVRLLFIYLITFLYIKLNDWGTHAINVLTKRTNE